MEGVLQQVEQGLQQVVDAAQPVLDTLDGVMAEWAAPYASSVANPIASYKDVGAVALRILLISCARFVLSGAYHRKLRSCPCTVSRLDESMPSEFGRALLIDCADDRGDSESERRYTFLFRHGIEPSYSGAFITSPHQPSTTRSIHP